MLSKLGFAPGFALLVSAPLVVAAGCGWPLRTAIVSERHGVVAPIAGFEDVRGIDGYPSDAIQANFDAAVAELARTDPGLRGRRAYDMLVLSSGGVNGAFGAGILTEWSRRGDRPDFWLVTGVSVGALLAPFAFAGPAFDARIEQLFRRIEPQDMHREKGLLASVLWDESLADNRPLRASIAEAVDRSLLEAVATKHEQGRRLFVGSTNLDVGDFVVWDMGAIAVRRTDEALELFRRVLTASASIPVVYPPVRFTHDDRDELHADGAVMRPLFVPQNVFDGYLSAERAGISWDDVDVTMYVIHNGSLRPCPVDVQRDTLGIALRTVTMMSYTMVSEHVLHLYLLSRAWGAEFRFVTMPDGLELAVDNFTPEDTDRLFLLGAGFMQRQEAWRTQPPGFVVREDLNKVQPSGPPQPEPRMPDPAVTPGADSDRLDRIEAQLQHIEFQLQKLLDAK